MPFHFEFNFKFFVSIVGLLASSLFWQFFASLPLDFFLIFICFLFLSFFSNSTPIFCFVSFFLWPPVVFSPILGGSMVGGFFLLLFRSFSFSLLFHGGPPTLLADQVSWWRLSWRERERERRNRAKRIVFEDRERKIGKKRDRRMKEGTGDFWDFWPDDAVRVGLSFPPLSLSPSLSSFLLNRSSMLFAFSLTLCLLCRILHGISVFSLSLSLSLSLFLTLKISFVERLASLD